MNYQIKIEKDHFSNNKKKNYLVCPTCQKLLCEFYYDNCCVDAVLTLKKLFINKLKRLERLLEVNGTWSGYPTANRTSWLKNHKLNKNYLRCVELKIQNDLTSRYFIK